MKMIWINGPFGGGKSTTALHYVLQTEGVRYFDPEWVGYMLRANLGDYPNEDFQDLSAWRALVPQVAFEVAKLTNETLVPVQTVLNQSYWHELKSGFNTFGFEVQMVLLDCDATEIERRAKSDEVDRKAEKWRIDHIGSYMNSREWLLDESTYVIDTTNLSIEEAVEELHRTLTD